MKPERVGGGRLLPRSMKQLGPCEGCEHEARCAVKKLACLDYARYLNRSEVKGREPTREIYRAVFG